MSVFTCEKCNSVFNRKYELQRHLNSVTDCVSGSKTNKKVTYYHCKKCNKSKFTRKDSLTRHQKTCKAPVKKIKNKTNNNPSINGNDNTITNNINTTNNNGDINTNNYHIHIHLNEYDAPNIIGKDCNIKSSELANILKSNENLIIGMIKETHCNPDKPQNHNIYYPDYKSSCGKVYKNQKIISKTIYDIIDRILDIKLEDLSNKINEDESLMDKQFVEKIKYALKNLNDHNPKNRKKIGARLKLLFYDNRDMIKKTLGTLLDTVTNETSGSDDDYNVITELNDDYDFKLNQRKNKIYKAYKLLRKLDKIYII